MTHTKIGSTNLGEPQALQRWEKVCNGIPKTTKSMVFNCEGLGTGVKYKIC